MWKIFVIVTLLSGQAHQQPIGSYEFESKKECAEYLSGNGMLVGLRARPFAAKLKKKEPIQSFQIACRR